MKKRTTTFVKSILPSMLIISLLASCGTNESPSSTNGSEENVPVSSTNNETASAFQSDPNLNKPGEFPICKETVTLSIGLSKSDKVEDYDTNKMTLALEEKGNFDLQFEYYPSGSEATQKVELMLSAGGKDLPDVLLVGLSDKSTALYGEGGFFVPMNDYIENSSAYISAAVERFADKNFLAQFTSPDGNVYTAPRYTESLVNEYENRIWIYQPWLDALNLEVPTTLEEYRDVLMAFKEQDPNGNGKKDEIPLMGSKAGGWLARYFDVIMTTFVYADSSRNFMVVNDDQTISLAYMTEEWKEGLRYMTDLCANGLLSPVSFTQDDTQAYQILNSPDADLVGSVMCGSPSGLNPDSERRLGFKTIAPFKNEDGEQTAIWKPTTVSNGGYITKNCENPEAAFRFLDLMCSEEFTIWNRWGEHGTDWLDPTEDQHGLYEEMGYDAMINPILQWNSIQNSHWQQTGPMIRGYEVAGGLISDTSNPISAALPAEQAKSDAIFAELAPKNVIYKIIYTSEELDIIGEYETTIKDFVNEKSAQFITGAIDLDSEWDNFLDELKAMGVEEYLSTVQTAYSRTIGK